MTTPYIATQGCTLYVLDDYTNPMSPVVKRVAAVKGITSLGGASGEFDISNLDSLRKEFGKGLQDGGTPSFDMVFNVNDTTHILMHTLAAAGADAVRSWYFAFSDGTAPPTFDSTGLIGPSARSGIVFEAFVKQFQVDAAIDNALNAKIQLRATGADTINVKV